MLFNIRQKTVNHAKDSPFTIDGLIKKSLENVTVEDIIKEGQYKGCHAKLKGVMLKTAMKARRKGLSRFVDHKIESFLKRHGFWHDEDDIQ